MNPGLQPTERPVTQSKLNHAYIALLLLALSEKTYSDPGYEKWHCWVEDIDKETGEIVIVRVLL